MTEYACVNACRIVASASVRCDRKVGADKDIGRGIIRIGRCASRSGDLKSIRLTITNPHSASFGNDVKFNLIDRIDQISDERIVAVKYVSLAEEYLADHFPSFPVLPGVMMLEALTQAAAWLMHRRTDFACSMAVLKEARKVKYGRFVAPGGALKVEVELGKLTDTGATFKAN